MNPKTAAFAPFLAVEIPPVSSTIGAKFVILMGCHLTTFFPVSSIWSTPRSAMNHAKQIRRVVDNCTEKD